MKPAFTLIEVLAALAILSIAFLVLMQSQTMSLGQVLRIQGYERGLLIAENQLHWTLLDLNDVESWEEMVSLSGEDGDYLWDVQISPVQIEQNLEVDVTMLRIVATTRWPEGRGMSEVQVETHYLWGEE